MSKNKKPYLPAVRTGYEPSKNDLISSSPKGVTTKLTNPVTDAITVNNIAWLEFDYTEKPYMDDDIDTNSTK